MPETFPWWQDILDVLTFPPSVLFGLVAGIACRRLIPAVLIAGIFSPSANVALMTAFSDAPPRFPLKDTVLLGLSGMLIAAIVWGIATAFRKQRRKASLS